MQALLNIIGIICTLAGTAVSVVGWRAKNLSEQVLRSLTQEDDFLFEASNSPSITVWENYQDTWIHYARLIGLILLAAGILILILTAVAFRKKNRAA